MREGIKQTKWTDKKQNFFLQNPKLRVSTQLARGLAINKSKIVIEVLNKTYKMFVLFLLTIK